jgi:hypothetical protein
MKTPIQVFFAAHHLLHLAVESTSEGTPSPMEKVPVRADEECEKVLFHGPQPTYATVPLSRRAKVNLGMWILRLRLLLRAE